MKKPKQPAILLYVGDLVKDPCVKRCSPIAKQVWTWLIFAMHEEGSTGQVHGTIETLARLCEVSRDEMIQSVREFIEHGTADVTGFDDALRNHGKFGICCRRIQREYGERMAAKTRMKQLRDKKALRKCSPDVLIDNEYLSSSLPDRVAEKPPSGAKTFAAIWAEVTGILSSAPIELVDASVNCSAVAASKQVDFATWTRTAVVAFKAWADGTRKNNSHPTPVSVAAFNRHFERVQAEMAKAAKNSKRVNIYAEES